MIASTLALTATPVSLEAVDNTNATYVYFSGSLTSVTDSFGDDITSSTGIDLSASDIHTWEAAWNYSSLTPLDISSISYDGDSGNYDITFYYESMSSIGNVFGQQLQQIKGATLEVNIDGGTDTISGTNSTILKTSVDSVVTRVRFNGTSSSSFNTFTIVFCTPVNATTDAFVYTVTDMDDGIIAEIDTTEVQALGQQIDAAF